MPREYSLSYGTRAKKDSSVLAFKAGFCKAIFKIIAVR